MGKKYIIELDDKPFHKEDGDFLYRVKGFNSLVFDMTGIDKLIPYTEPDLEQVKADWYKAGREAEKVRQPDLEQVREEAYEKGYENGFIAGHLKAEKSGQSFYEDGYQRGMADANRDGEYNADDGWYVMQKISFLPNPIKTELFGTAETAVILQDNSFKDALAKLAEYEQEKDRQARIEYNFDEIKDVLETTAKECNVSLDEIAEVLQKMKEN